MTESSSSNVQANLPLNEIAIRKWDLNENSTHYDRLVAAPSDEDLIKFWAGWSSIMLATGVLTTAIWIPLMSSKKVKKNPFNLYLIFLLTPDMLVAWTCGFTCLTNALAGRFTSEFMCYFQSWYMISSICANSWLNAMVAYQLYTMLSSAQRFVRYQPPNAMQVCKHAACIYLYSCFLGSWGLIPVDWWPHKTRLTIGSACIPMDYSTASTIFFYCVFFPLLFGIPLVYVCWSAYKIYKDQMLPPSGRRRILAIYFFRLAFVFLVMWLPGLLLLFVTGAWLDPWVEWVGGSWSHLQGAVSALVCLLKPDIWKTVRNFWTCNTLAKDDDNEDSEREMSWFTSFDKIVGSTRASFRVSLKVLGGGVKRIQRAASLSSARLDLLDDMSSSSSSSSSSGSVVIEKKDNVLTSGNFTVETCSNSVPASQELVSQNSLSFLQMLDDSSSSSADDDAHERSCASFVTDEMRSLQSLRNTLSDGSSTDSDGDDDDGERCGVDASPPDASLRCTDLDPTTSRVDEENGIVAAYGGQSSATAVDEDCAASTGNDPSFSDAAPVQHPPNESFQNGSHERQPMCTEQTSASDTFDNECTHDIAQSPVHDGSMTNINAEVVVQDHSLLDLEAGTEGKQCANMLGSNEEADDWQQGVNMLSSNEEDDGRQEQNEAQTNEQALSTV